MNEGAPGRPSDVYHRYHLDRHAEAHTGEELQDRVRREHRERYGPFGGYVGAIMDPGRVDDLLDRQAAQLKDGVLTRTAPDQPGTYYLGISHQQLYDGVHDGVDPAQVGEIASMWTDLGNRLATFNENLVTAIGNSEGEWVGEAGDHARQALARMGNRAGETGVSAQLAGTLFTQQSRALADAKNSVPPPPARPFDVQEANDRLLRITDPIQIIQQAAADRAAFEQQQKDHREAARVVETYDRTVAQTAAAQPAFAPPPVVAQQDSVAEATVDARESSSRRVGPVPEVSGHTETSRSTPTRPPDVGRTEPGGPLPVGGVTQPSGHGQGTEPLPGKQVGVPGGAVPGVGGGVVPGPVPGGRGGSAANGAGGGRAGGSAGRGGAGRIGGGGGTGAGRPGIGGTGVGAPGIGGPGLAGPGGASGVGPPGGATSGGARGGGPGGVRGGGGAAGVGPVVGGGAPREEDAEHQTPSYLLEPDPDEVFGASGTSAPPVIGDWDR